MENDCIKRRGHNHALAPPWWERFGFRLHKAIKYNSIIFGAVYEYEGPASVLHHPCGPPRYVAAFRGTMLRAPRSKLLRATSTNARCATTRLLYTTNGTSNVCLAGHSLGASQALDVGRFMMAEKGLNLPTFLFNPPPVSLAPAINLLRPTEKAKMDLCAMSYLLKAGLCKVLNLKPHKERMKKLFERLSPWAPELYVHEKDPICKGYIDYFEQRQQVQERFHRVAKSAMMLSYRDMICSSFGKEKERPHLLPSARLWKNTSMDGDAHALREWWKADGDFELEGQEIQLPMSTVHKDFCC
ncbi:hypothetical protein E2562_003882 [Oryza meyeriana var. granulata]|uniref:Fungal lipase-like domain-containing protein n=1 Tax=Oryza meyeriana var. granulata TaxID=110450 RepID=A0A6G1CZF6_9ORYZ|nr:hypothetical protein E2562_003882 [Oryza meyeriana var. granulata]